jgi:serine/threonine-protein kinase
MLSAGTVLHARYRIDRPLDVGAMGATYRGWDLERQVRVSIKELTPQADLSAEALAALREQLEQRAAALMRLRHPHMVHVVDVFHVTPEPSNPEATPELGALPQAHSYLVMDFVEGESLATQIQRRGAQREEDVLAWADQILDALALCHAQGLLHRDLKPQNVILRADGSAVLVGFELTKLWDPNNPRTWTATRVMGSPEYAPPERWGLQTWHIDERSDLYSLGATLYHALTGHAPQTAGQRTANPYQFQPLRALSPRVSTSTRSAVLRAMELPRDKRFQSAEQMRDALSGASSTPISEAVAPASLILSSDRRVHWGRWAVGLALSALLLALAGLLGTVAPRVVGALRRPTPTPTAVAPTATATATPTPAPSATPTRTPSPIPTVTPAASTALSPSVAPVTWTVTLADAFVDNANDWIVSEYEDDWGAVTRVITDGTYLWTLSAAQSVSRWCMPEITSTGDLYLAVDAQRLRGPEDASYGLVFRHAAGNYYLFGVRDDGYVRLSLWYDYAWDVIQDWVETPVVRPGAVNRLEVLAQGAQFTLAVNGDTVIEAEDDQLAAGESGLSAMLITPGEAVFRFDNFELRAQP